MQNPRLVVAGLAVAGLAALAAYGPSQPSVPPKKPAPKVAPAPKPTPPPDCPDGKCPAQPKRPRRPWGEGECAPVGASRTWRQWPNTREFALLEDGRQVGSFRAEEGVYRELRADGTWGPKTWLPGGVPHPEGDVRGGPVAPDGTEVQCEVPVEFRTRNIGSKVGRHAGMCVTTSTSVAAKWAGLDQWVGLRDWAAQFPGGSDPYKQLDQLAQYAKEKGLPEAPWAQYVGGDPAPFLDAVLSSGRVACVSWMQGGHWLNLVHLDSKNACIMDNNGDPRNLQWMSRASALSQISAPPPMMRGPFAWVGCWLPPGPPVPPKNANVSAVPDRGVVLPRHFADLPAYGGCSERGVFLPASVGADEITIRGKPATIDDLKAALGQTAAPRLTVIGTPEQAAPVLAAHGSALTSASYSPDAWQVSGMGFAQGKPAIYLQSADGTVLHRQAAYDADALSEAIRKARPDYKPDADPTPETPSGDSGVPAGTLPLLGLGGLVAGAVWLKKRKAA